MEKIKINKKIILKSIFVLSICILFYIFIQFEILPIDNGEKIGINNKEEYNNSIKYFETPDRIVYKEKGEEDKYYVFEQQSEEYDKIVNQLIKSIDSISEGLNLSQDEINNIEGTKSYIELDYNTISKNYIINFQDDKYNVIKRNDNGGVVVKNNLTQKEELNNLISDLITENSNYYKMSDTKQYKVNEAIIDDSLVTNQLKVYETGIYGKILDNKEEWESYKKENKITSLDIPDDEFKNTNVLLLASKYNIGYMDTRIGGLTINFNGQPLRNKLYVYVICLSKAINKNCIYRNLDNVEPEERIYGEELKKEILSHSEIDMRIKNLTKQGNNIVITGEIQYYYDQYDIVKFEIEVLVNKETVISSSTQDQYKQLESYKERGDTIYVTLNTEEKAKGNLVATNIEIMGC